MSDILTTQADGILTITFNRPDKKNALTSAMYATLATADMEREPLACRRGGLHQQVQG